MNLNKFRGCPHVVYTANPLESWCWKTRKNVRDYVKCPYDHIPLRTNNPVKHAVGSPKVGRW